MRSKNCLKEHFLRKMLFFGRKTERMIEEKVFYMVEYIS